MRKGIHLLHAAAVRAGSLGAFAALILLFVAPVHAAVPTQTQVEGLLLAAGGSPAADGPYQLGFALYAAATGGAALWSEGPVAV
jgi:hypothetical protein